jgi:hypothetical protein
MQTNGFMGFWLGLQHSMGWENQCWKLDSVVVTLYPETIERTIIHVDVNNEHYPYKSSLKSRSFTQIIKEKRTKGGMN